MNTSHLFPTSPTVTPRIGAELELLVRDADTGAIALLDGVLGDWLRATAEQDAWSSLASSKGAPKYGLPSGGTITLEPGGQLEISTQPHATPHALIEDIQAHVRSLEGSAHSYNLVLTAIGIDPVHSLKDTPLQLTAERYTRMDAYLNTISSAGARMMRQTAALQVSVDAAHDPALTWSVLNRAAPVLTALFANSRLYEGRDSRNASYRAQMWRELDPTRTGVREDAAAYESFAMAARCIADAPRYRPFSMLEQPTTADWELHLSTLFPEVRPKQYFEIRCIDSIPPFYAAAPVLIVAALAWDCDMLREAAHFLPAAGEERLLRAARYGMADAEFAEDARRLVELTAGVCARNEGSGFSSEADVEALSTWLERSLTAHRAPLEHNFVGNDHIADDALARFGK